MMKPGKRNSLRKQTFVLRKDRRKRRKRSGLPVLSFMIMLSMILLGAVWAYVKTEGIALSRLTASSEHVTDEDHGIAMGMTPKAIALIHPDFEFRITEQGAEGSFNMANSRHDVWFRWDGKRHRAYKVRYEKTFDKLDEDDVVLYFAKRYKNPIYDKCRNTSDNESRRCHFRWLGGNSTSVDVFTRAITLRAPNGKLHATIIATDTSFNARGKVIFRQRT